MERRSTDRHVIHSDIHYFRFGGRTSERSIDQYFSDHPEWGSRGAIMNTRDAIPVAPGALPLVGHALPLLRNPLSFLDALPDHGELVRIRLGPLPVVVVCDPNLTREVLLDDRTFDKGGPYFDRAREALGDGLGTCPRSRHRRQRRLIQPAFHPSRLPRYTQMMTDQILAVTSDWHDGGLINLPAEMATLATRIAARTMFSDTPSPQSFGQAVDALTTILAGIIRQTIMPPLFKRLPTPANRHYTLARTRLRQIAQQMINHRRASRIDQGDLLSPLLTLAASTGHRSPDYNQQLTDKEVIDQVVTFLIGGSDTVAIILSWALYLIAVNPDIRNRLHAEIDSVLSDGTLPEINHLPQLKLTGHVVTEVLRLYPPAGSIITRMTARPARLGGYSIPAGTIIAYSPYLIHHRKDLYQRPSSFDPDRWESACLTGPPRHAFIPFGGGPRKCIGDQFGITEATLALAAVSSRWSMEPVPGQRVRPSLTARLSPQGLRMRIHRRAPTTAAASTER